MQDKSNVQESSTIKHSWAISNFNRLEITRHYKLWPALHQIHKALQQKCIYHTSETFLCKKNMSIYLEAL